MPRLEKGRRVKAAAARLRELFQRSGYIRRRSNDQVAPVECGVPAPRSEVRLTVKTMTEARRVVRWCTRMGFRTGVPYKKHRHVVQPVYGADAVGWFEGGG